MRRLNIPVEMGQQLRMKVAGPFTSVGEAVMECSFQKSFTEVHHFPSVAKAVMNLPQQSNATAA
jgi:hypothetical protein